MNTYILLIVFVAITLSCKTHPSDRGNLTKSTTQKPADSTKGGEYYVRTPYVPTPYEVYKEAFRKKIESDIYEDRRQSTRHREKYGILSV